MRVYDRRGKSYELDRTLGRGGEATIWAVQWRRRLVAKVYHKPHAEREQKLGSMIAMPPADQGRKRGQVSICWPQSLLFDQDRRIIGFLMPRVDLRRHRELFKISTPLTRMHEAPGFTWDYLIAAAENISRLIDSIHQAGYVVGDLNESNLFISDSARVSLVDCDSFQVSARGRVFPCIVGKPEFLAPELYGADLSTRVRTRYEDYFALAVLIFQLLMEGVHPYSGKWQGAGDLPPLAERIAAGDTPYAGSSRMLRSPVAPPFEMLPVNLRQMFARAFLQGNRDPRCRPSAAEWQRALHGLRAQIKSCPLNPRHRFSSHLANCPWCDRATACGLDPYPPPGVAPHGDLGPRTRVGTDRVRPRTNGMSGSRLDSKVLRALVTVGPILSAALSAWLSGPGGVEMIRETAVLAALFQCARAVHAGRIGKSGFLLAAGFLCVALTQAGSPREGAVRAALEAIVAFFAARCLLAMLKSSFDRLLSKSRVSAAAWILSISLLLCPSIGILNAAARWVHHFDLSALAKGGNGILGP